MKIIQAKHLLFAFSLLFVSQVYAETDFVVEKIELVGAQRITYATVSAYLTIKVGDKLTAQRTQEVLKSLYGTGFFKDISLSRRDNTLIITVKERPGIAEINIDGNKKIKDKDINKAFDEAGLVRGRIYNDQMLDTMQKELERIYYSYGRYGVKLKSTVTPLVRNRVKIDIDIKEGLPAKIRDINIVGNNSFSDEELLDQFELGIPSWWAIFSSKDQYAKEKLSGDRETLRSYYMDRGYVKYKLESVQVTISPDKKDIYLTMNVTEGERYKVRDVNISGNTIVKKDGLLAVVKATNPSGEYFSNKNVTDSIEYINKSLGNIGYAFADTQIETKVDDDEYVVDLNFYVIPNKRVYVRRIEFIDNEKSQDEVYRRELRQMEGAWYSDAGLERSKVRLQRLPYVEEVELEKNTVAGTDDQMDVAYKMKERLAGAFNLGVGFSDENGATFSTSIEHNNVFGKGNSVGLSFMTNDVITAVNYNYVNPYYTPEGVSRGLNFYATEYDTSKTLLTQYVVNNIGGRVTYQIPTTEFSAFRFGLGFTKTEIDLQLGTNTFEVLLFLSENGNEYDQYMLSTAYVYDTRNRGIFPDKGTRQVVSLEVNPEPSDLQYYKFNYSADYYWPVTTGSVLHTKYNLGYGAGIDDQETLPFFEKYSTGGIHSVRGFESRSLGPHSHQLLGPFLVDSGQVLGGDLLTTASIEYILPPPKDAAGSMRFLLFYDIGNVYADKDDFDAGELRSSYGLAFNWLAPVGAVTFSYANPVRRQDGDEIERFQFTIGGSF